MTSRSHETIRVGLRRIIRDQSVRPSMRMDAIRILMRVEGLMEEAGSVKKKPAIAPMSKKLLEIMELAGEQNAG